MTFIDFLTPKHDAGISSAKNLQNTKKGEKRKNKEKNLVKRSYNAEKFQVANKIPISIR